jgi:hypothetical protein
VNGCFVVLGSNVAAGGAEHATAAAVCDLERAKASAALQAALGQLQVPAVDCVARWPMSAEFIDA